MQRHHRQIFQSYYVYTLGAVMRALSILFYAAMAVLPAEAQETDAAGKLAVELNAAETTQGNCRLTFLITNGLAADLEKTVYETVLFNKSGQVDRLTLFDFGALPHARPRVRQFAVPGVTCDSLGRILFNGANTCVGEGLDPKACDAGFTPTSRTDIEVLG